MRNESEYRLIAPISEQPYILTGWPNDMRRIAGNKPLPDGWVEIVTINGAAVCNEAGVLNTKYIGVHRYPA